MYKVSPPTIHKIETNYNDGELTYADDLLLVCKQLKWIIEAGG